jgi:hypothetical protein
MESCQPIKRLKDKKKKKKKKAQNSKNNILTHVCDQEL